MLYPSEMVGVLMPSATFNLYVPFHVQWLLLKLLWDERASGYVHLYVSEIACKPLEENLLNGKVNLQVFKILHFGVFEHMI